MPLDYPDFTRAVRLLGIDAAGDPVAVLVDGDGNLNAILKGEGATGLTTIAVDANGRIEAFMLDSESQWGDVLRIGNAEMAARLGSLRAWDWRGQTLLASDFRDGMGNVLKYPEGTGSSISLDPTYSQSGGYSVRLVGGSDGDRYARCDFLVEHPPSLQMGLEATFSGVADYDNFKIEMRRYTGGRILIAAIRYDFATGQIQYRDGDGNWQNIANPHFLDGGEMFHRLKVVADFDTKKYIRILYADTEFDASAIDLYDSGGGFLSAVYCEIRLTSRAANNDVAYLDSYAVTVSEPL